MGDGDAAFESLFAPSSIAVVGASPDSWYISRLVDNLLGYGFDGELHLINPGRETAWDRPCYDSLSALPEPVDLVVVSVPREYVVETVREAGELGYSGCRRHHGRLRRGGRRQRAPAGRTRGGHRGVRHRCLRAELYWPGQRLRRDGAHEHPFAGPQP